MKPRKVLLLAIFSGLITTLLFYMFINQKNSSAAGEEETVAAVAIAKQDINKDGEITEEMLSIVMIPEEQIHSQAVRDKEAVLGRYASADIKTGEQIMKHRVQQTEEEDTFVSKKVTDGYRAVSISVDYVKSVSNLIEPEDHVDVVLSEQLGESTKTEAILEKVRVLSVGKRMVEKKQEEPDEEYHAVTVELTQTDAIELINASQRGNLQLVLLSKLLSGEGVAEEELVRDETTDSLEIADSNLIPLPERSLIREAPSLQAPILTAVDQGVQLKYLEEQKMDEEKRIWFYVETPEQNVKGWISSRIIKGEYE